MKKKKVSYIEMNRIAEHLKSFGPLAQHRPLTNEEIQYIQDYLTVPNDILVEYQREKGVSSYENYKICWAQGRD